MRRRPELQQIRDEIAGVEAAIGSDGNAPLARRGGYALDHLDRRHPLGMAGNASRLDVDDEAVAVLHQDMPLVAEHRKRCSDRTFFAAG